MIRRGVPAVPSMVKGRLVSALVVGAVITGVLSTGEAGTLAEKPTRGMVLIHGGSFVMGADASDGKVGIEVGVDSLPRHRRHVDSFWIDRTEVTNEQYREFIRATGRQAPVDPKFPDYFSWQEGNFPPGLDRHPVVYVDWADADAYCQWVGKRLPTEAEWERAARGTDGRRYPWGDDFAEGLCNTLETHLGWTAPVASFDGDVSPDGVRDMCGNVSEWTSDWYQPYPGSTLKRRSFGEKYKVARGSNWMLSFSPYARASNRTLSYEPTKRHRGIGFRCALSVEDVKE